jgi:hypothetical protein
MELKEIDGEIFFEKTSKKKLHPRNVAVKMSHVLEALELHIPSKIDANEFLKHLVDKMYEDNGI